MKIVRNILSIILVTAFFNVVVSKSMHEMFEHNHELELCENDAITHFHQHELQHLDFICSFNFATSFFENILHDYTGAIRYQESKVRIHFLWLAKSLCTTSISLRGPPSKI